VTCAETASVQAGTSIEIGAQIDDNKHRKQLDGLDISCVMMGAGCGAVLIISELAVLPVPAQLHDCTAHTAQHARDSCQRYVIKPMILLVLISRCWLPFLLLQ
jgi:hypothetical protein